MDRKAIYSKGRDRSYPWDYFIPLDMYFKQEFSLGKKIIWYISFFKYLLLYQLSDIDQNFGLKGPSNKKL